MADKSGQIPAALNASYIDAAVSSTAAAAAGQSDLINMCRQRDRSQALIFVRATSASDKSCLTVFAEASWIGTRVKSEAENVW